ncbi:molybdopterin converting factor subunit 1 [Gottfriedia solisilvae]|uniref:Molybdopterin synthase sulfur carrier subunit n=1 Tax=Gottfriedia solisilvae TaxID=1516104 RepID=A0A8J3AQ01_9BACI|nr:molybdopterin converting factor subunit 1 [Gottfriedia solisilvae]GGI17815.1 molybdopterin synthase sulfur carrier subunit [Gottfriedia solisilvae]
MIKVLLFAHLREKVGVEELTLIENEGIKVKDLKSWLTKNYDLQSLNQVMTAVNEEFVTDEDIVNAGDIVAFIPPVSGG